MILHQVLEQFHVPRGAPGQEYAARSLRTFLTEEYAVKLFDSCREVQAFGVRAILLVCSNEDCTYVVSSALYNSDIRNVFYY